jgi:hypothetical protein
LKEKARLQGRRSLFQKNPGSLARRYRNACLSSNEIHQQTSHKSQPHLPACWSLVFGASLVLGAWILEFSVIEPFLAFTIPLIVNAGSG